VLIKLFESEIKLMLKLQIGQILTKSNSTYLEFEHAFKRHTCQILYALLK